MKTNATMIVLWVLEQILCLINFSLRTLLPLKFCLLIWQCHCYIICNVFPFIAYSFASFQISFYRNQNNLQFPAQRFSLPLDHKYVIILNMFKIRKFIFKNSKNVQTSKLSKPPYFFSFVTMNYPKFLQMSTVTGRGRTYNEIR